MRFSCNCWRNLGRIFSLKFSAAQKMDLKKRSWILLNGNVKLKVINGIHLFIQILTLLYLYSTFKFNILNIRTVFKEIV